MPLQLPVPALQYTYNAASFLRCSSSTIKASNDAIHHNYEQKIVVSASPMAMSETSVLVNAIHFLS